MNQVELCLQHFQYFEGHSSIISTALSKALPTARESTILLLLFLCVFSNNDNIFIKVT